MITYVRTNDQVADVLTREMFHRKTVESMVVVVVLSLLSFSKAASDVLGDDSAPER